MNSILSPEAYQGFVGNIIKSSYSLKLWLVIAWVGFIILPWYAAYDGFWSFIWITDGYPTFDEYSPGILQITMHQRWWLWPVALSLLVPFPALFLPRTDPRHVAVLLVGGGFGFAYMLAQGFILGLHGWGWIFLGDIFGPTTQTQMGLGYGALLVCAGFLFLFTQGLAARGAIKGDVFVSGTIGLSITMVTAFVFYPVGKILINAVKNDEGDYAFSLFLEKISSHNIWSLACLNSDFSCGVAWNSLWMAVLVGLATTVLGLTFALLVTRTGMQAKGLVRTVSLLPIITPPFVIGLALILLFGRAGAVNSFLEWAFDIEPTRWIYGLTGILVAQILAFTPIAFLVLIGVVEGVSPSMEEAAQTLNASPWQTFWTVSFPLMRPGLANAFLLGFIESLADFGNPLVLGGQYEVLSTQIFFAIAGAQGDLGMAAVLAIVLLLFTLSAFYAQRRWLGKKSYATVTGKGDSGKHAQLPKRVTWGAYLAATPFISLSLVVYGMILFGGFVETWGHKHNFTFKHYIDEFSINWSEQHGIIWDGAAWNSFWTTLQISAISAPLTAGLGLLTAYILVRQKFWGKDVFEFLTMLSFAVPGTVIGVGYILAFNVPPIEMTGTGVILVVCFIFRNMPTGIRAGIAAMSQLDPSLDEASLTLGARSFTTLRRVLLPLLRPAIIAALVFSFVRAMTAISAVIFLVSADYDMATSYILGRVEFGDYGLAIAYSSVLILVMLCAIALIQFTVGKRELGRREKEALTI
ncbi:MAG: iron ABC transporter permease [SAR324 cluster bacterium]